MNKKRLLIWADSPAISTGFGIVTKNLCDHLYKDFDIFILGINHAYPDLTYDKEKYYVLKVDPGDLLGYSRFVEAVDIARPDIILLFQDIFNIFPLKTEHTEIFNKIPHVLYFPVDGRPFSRAWKDTLLSSDQIVTYTNWGSRIIKQTIPEVNNIHILPHGINTSIFYPESRSNIKMYRRTFGWHDKFMVSNINRFQPRKHVNQTLRIMSMVSNGYYKCKCGNIYPKHLPECDLNGCSPADRVESVKGLKDTALYLHMNLMEKMMGDRPSDWLTTYAYNNGYTKDDMTKTIFFNSRTVYNKQTEMTPEELNMIYNSSDIVLSTSIGEGFGFSTAEAMATGTTVLVGRHSANFDLIENEKQGILLKNRSLFSWGRDSAHVRPIIDEQDAVDNITRMYNMWKDNNNKKIINEDAVQQIKDKYLWEDKAEKLKLILNTAYNNRRGS